MSWATLRKPRMLSDGTLKNEKASVGAGKARRPTGVQVHHKERRGSPRSGGRGWRKGRELG